MLYRHFAMCMGAEITAHRVMNYIEDKATQILFGWKLHEFWPEYEG